MNTNKAICLLNTLRNASADDSNAMTLPQALIFLTISQHSGISLRDLCEKAGYSAATVTQMVYTLGKGRKRGGDRRPGLELVESTQSDTDFRVRYVTLTSKGEELMRKIYDI